MVARRVELNYSNRDVVVFGKHIVLFVLLYADDTALFANNYQDMQNLLNVFDCYCTKWKLTVNCKKNKKKKKKVLIFNGSKKYYKYVFYLSKSKLDSVESYKYLGIIFHKSSEYKGKKHALYTSRKKHVFRITTRQIS